MQAAVWVRSPLLSAYRQTHLCHSTVLSHDPLASHHIKCIQPNTTVPQYWSRSALTPLRVETKWKTTFQLRLQLRHCLQSYFQPGFGYSQRGFGQVSTTAISGKCHRTSTAVQSESGASLNQLSTVACIQWMQNNYFCHTIFACSDSTTEFWFMDCVIWLTECKCSLDKNSIYKELKNHCWLFICWSLSVENARMPC